MRKRNIILAGAIIIIILGVIIIAYAKNMHSTLSDKKLRPIGNNVLIYQEPQKNTIEVGKGEYITVEAEGNRVLKEAYVIEDGEVKTTEIRKKTFVINEGKQDEKTVEFAQVIKDGEIVSVYPVEKGPIMNFSQGKNKIIFTDNGSQSLWVADKSLDNIVNIQPDTVGPYSKQVLMEEKKKLEGKDIDTDVLILYWAARPMLSPDEDKVVFQSNRSGYPYNCRISLWVTDMEGNTSQIVAEEKSVAAIGWLSNEEILFRGNDYTIKKVSLKDGKISTVIDKPASVSVSGIIPGGNYLIYQNMTGASSDKELYQYNLTTNKSTLISLPDGYTTSRFYDWHPDKSKVVFYVVNGKTNLKILVHDCATGKTTEIFAPGNTEFESSIRPKWNNDNVIFCAGGKTYSVNVIDR
jgi:WD40 repeat protein